MARPLESLDQTKVVRRRVRISGQVQGVGFRPFVYRLASTLRLAGWVVNDSGGVTIEAQGPAGALREFLHRLESDRPPLAILRRCQVEEVDAQEPAGAFEIGPSRGGELADAQVTVDTAVCDDCLREMRDPADPRYAYPFINCTNCGPRYTLVQRIPYDRPNTTMSPFAMCPACLREYHDPSSRRFHAQPIACGRCGPQVWLVDGRGRQIPCESPLARAAERLLEGRIVAIKGLGGFHLACRADDEHAVVRLRRRKRRDAKPFALMVASLEQAERLCAVSPPARDLLAGPLRPVVILPRRDGTPVAASVAAGLNTLGLMLPYTPLHFLLFEALGADAPALVMTSGNYSEEPLVKDNDAAVSHLGRIADAILLHNRAIERRLDDSVVQAHEDGELSVLRRARGYAPQPVVLAGATASGPAILAVGAELKSAVCLYRGGRAVLSEHIGDLKDGRAYRHFIDTIHHLEALFELSPEAVAADLHPQYLSSEYAARRHRGEVAGRAAIPLVRVQHHHAHVAACLAENGWEGPALGLACDGAGLGEDEAVWGCEVLRVEAGEYERLGHLRYLPLIGGDAAAVQTWRPALAALLDALGPRGEEIARERLAVGELQLSAAIEQRAAGVHCPPASSLGRWFDAAAALAGVAGENLCEGLAPMKLEATIDRGVAGAYPFEIGGQRPFQIDLRPMVEAMVGDLSAGEPAGRLAARFHNTAADFLAAAAARARELTGLDAVALSGGCFANRYLTARLAERLAAEGFRVLRHRTIPCNDGGVALGQAVVAAARIRGG